MKYSNAIRHLSKTAVLMLTVLFVFFPAGTRGEEPVFRRGDTDANGNFSIGDPIELLNFLFLDAGEPLCKDASDVNDDGELTVVDAIYELFFLFQGTSPPAPPWPGCGIDPTGDDSLGCEGYDAGILCIQNLEPGASFTASTLAGEAPLEVTFDASGSSDLDGTVMTHGWSFGDSSGDTGEIAVHTFTEAGSFTVVLTVTDDQGGTDSTNKTVYVKPATTFEEEVHYLTNLERAAHDLPPLKHHSQLREAIRGHCEDMAEQGYFQHMSLDGRNPGDRISETGYNWFGWAENIAAGYSSPAKVVDAWMTSPGHRANILGANHRELGVGYVLSFESAWWRYWGQNFALRHRVYPLVIANEATCTASPEVELYVYGAGWAEEMQISNQADFEDAVWQPYESSPSWSLTPGSGEKTVYVRLRNGNTVKEAEDEITLLEETGS